MTGQERQAAYDALQPLYSYEELACLPDEDLLLLLDSSGAARQSEAEALALEICQQFGRSPADPEAWAECLHDAQSQLSADAGGGYCRACCEPTDETGPNRLCAWHRDYSAEIPAWALQRMTADQTQQEEQP